MVLCLLRKRIIHQLRYACLAFIGTGWHQDNAYYIFFSFNFTFVFFSKDTYLPFYCNRDRPCKVVKLYRTVETQQVPSLLGLILETILALAPTLTLILLQTLVRVHHRMDRHRHISLFTVPDRHLSHSTEQHRLVTSFNWKFYIGWLVIYCHLTRHILCSSQVGSSGSKPVVIGFIFISVLRHVCLHSGGTRKFRLGVWGGGSKTTIFLNFSF